VVSFPEMVRTVSGLGEVRYALGDRLVDRYLEFVAGRARPNALRAVAFDLKTFFTVVAKDPVPVTAPGLDADLPACPRRSLRRLPG
jgi:integrase/recombinase XerD